jgi:glycosyltransferase involved in cell wall biosynthesis
VTVGVIIPVLNGAATLPTLLGEIRALHPEFALLVVDDGSTDGTAGAARAARAEVVSHPENRGKGAALATGFAQALERGWEWAYTLDADGQHLPSEMGRFLDVARRGGYDVVVGTRMTAPTGMPWVRKATNRFTSTVVSRLAGQRIPDSQCGFRLFRAASLRGLRLRTTRFDTESEILVRLARRGARIGEAPISIVYGEERSAIRPGRDTVRFFRLVALLLRDRED